MGIKDLVALIDAQLKALGIKSDAASKDAGHPDAIRNIRRAAKDGRGRVSAEILNALAPVLKLEPADLLAALDGKPRSTGSGGGGMIGGLEAELARIEAEAHAIRTVIARLKRLQS